MRETVREIVEASSKQTKALLYSLEHKRMREKNRMAKVIDKNPLTPLHRVRLADNQPADAIGKFKFMSPFHY